MDKALNLTEGFKKEIELKANPTSIRYGVMSTGQYAGAIAFFQNYESLADFEKSFVVYQAANDYQELFNSGNASVIMRNIAKYLDIPFEQKASAKAKYLVLTRVSGQGSMENEITSLAPVFANGGALTYRLANVITGSNVGNQLLGVTYSSMADIETVYDNLANDETYSGLLGKVDVNMRNIISLK
jgi:predicted TIM-barrel enzyme